ncbi:SNF2 helicase associated domain-containing protein [Clostridium sp. MSJ-4]|uniref:SNF2 helicase associated domain-containing protein n=1 Tax=Clostridium simiarum TaxID=2841506 RepID=A0ABS6F0V7_9CLOT|nr:SNF2 helicase associated domain-containing protein [Clostridium simiarum]MBU5592137.1 SNF2 helicase associated domain-containing protein [Clostridium simiarum]
MILNEDIIVSLSGDLIFKWGVEYYNKGLVEDFNVCMESNHNSQVNTYYIDAWVHEKEDLAFNVQISFNDLEGFTVFYCDCGELGADKSGCLPCKHVVAVLYKYLKEKQYNSLKARSLMKCEKLIGDMEHSLFYIENKKIPLNINMNYIFNLDGDMPYSIEIKVGKDKCYVVKDVSQFLDTVYQGGAIEFGKGFFFDSLYYEFCGENKKILDILLEIYEIDRMKGESLAYFPSKNRLIYGKRVFIVESHLRRFLQLMNNRVFSCFVNGEVYKDVKYLEEDMPLEFLMTTSESFIILKHNHEIPIALTEKRDLFFFKGNIYRPSKKQLEVYGCIYNNFMENRVTSLTFNAKDIDKLSYCILPSLRYISERVIISKDLKVILKEEKLDVEFYLDFNNKSIECTLIFNYGGYRINPLEGLNKKRYNEKNRIIRDMTKELEISGLLKKLGFLEEKNFYVLKDSDLIISFNEEGKNILDNKGKVEATAKYKHYLSSRNKRLG